MTGPTDIEVEQMVEALRAANRHIVADMMLALKARAEAAEERAHYATGVADTNITRAEAAEEERDNFRPAGEMLLALKARAEAAEEQLRHFGELHRAEWQAQVARAEAAEKREVEWREKVRTPIAQREALLAVLKEIANAHAESGDDAWRLRKIARAALEAKP